MPFPLSTLIGSRRRLVAAILLFLALDLTVLLTNLWIARHVAGDAVAINLAGRQRMLSQRMTKALLLRAQAADPVAQAIAEDEFRNAHAIFMRTLDAFAGGGQTTGSDGRPVVLDPVSDRGAAAVASTQALLAPLPASLADEQQAGLQRAADYLVEHNVEILTLMNTLTTALERDSVRRTEQLRLIQSGAFLLALANFVLIVVGLNRRFREAEEESARWQALARLDPLTGLSNRKGFFEAAARQLARAKRGQEPGSLILLDLDGFKPVNDRLGHPVGDAVLVRFAERLRLTARQSDEVARIGGDEFVLLCPGLVDAHAIDDLCRRIVEAMAELTPDELAPKQLGVSIGVASFFDHGYDIDTLIAQADHAMYEAKRGGGDRWHRP
ncbi:diguanylate cyclase [Nitrogeniibacter mangrovi]|uniref:Diguanylate cyclase n=1 Tax=Nitrogeniibacter mangrovi TaxID=2016596 RepID=A0A6C1B4H2_9RHOO|nr:diguanylate cyclase [Nitrogeniibacter mangrovi]QID17170.1 diguanylate cyclase [Nitrogeniibacter mangrovi]